MINNALVVVNGKGGVLKTSMTAQLAGLAAEAGWRVLAVDLDQQGNLARDLGYADRSDGGQNLLEAVMGTATLTPLTGVRRDLDVVPGGPYHLRLYREVAGGPAGNLVPTYGEIERVLRPLSEQYDLIVMDAPPGGESIHLAALTAARWVLIPTQPDQGSLDGLTSVFRTMQSVRDTTNRTLSVLGVVLGPVPSQASRVREDAFEHLRRAVGADVHVFDRAIRHAQTIAVHCRDRGLLVHEYAKASEDAAPWYKLSREERSNRKSFSQAAPGLAEDYQVLVDEILGLVTDAFVRDERTLYS